MSRPAFASVLVVLAAAALAARAGADETLDRWIARLGSDSWTERERASEALAAMGAPALPALLAAAGSQDGEVRERALRAACTIRARIDAEKREAALLAALEREVEELRGSGADLSDRSPPPLRGRVAGVDREKGVVWLDLARSSGIGAGAILHVFRGDSAVGQVVVENVREDGSTARVDPSSSLEPPRGGDEVTSVSRTERIRDLHVIILSHKSPRNLGCAGVPRPLDGKIVAVNADVLLCMVNLGEKEGVEKGMVFTVYRGNAYIGQVVVDQVYPDMCSARIDPRFLKEAMKEADDVTTRIR